MPRGRKPGTKNKHISSKLDDFLKEEKIDIKCPVEGNVQKKVDINKNETNNAEDLLIESKIVNADSHIGKKILPKTDKTELTKEQKEKLIKAKATMNTINKNMGANTVHFADAEETKERALFGVELLDKLTGGIPYGAFSVLWGNKSCTKTTLAYLTIANAQRQGKMCAHWDLEGSYDEEWACKMGVNKDNLILGRFKNAEEAMDALMKLCEERAIDFIVIDSVQALSPQGEQETKAGVEKSMANENMALLARKLSEFFRRANSGVFKGKVGVLLIGQTRMDLGSFVKLETLSGGHALAHWATIIVHLRRGQKADSPQYKYKDNENKTQSLQLGFDLVAKLTKTKISNTAIEGTDIHIPFYYQFAFTKPNEQQIKETFLQEITEEEKAFEELEKNEKE